MLSAIITSKGQTTIPKQVREFLNLHSGDRIDFILEEDGRVSLRPSTLDVQCIKGLLNRPGMKKMTIEEMNNVISKNAQRGNR